jgi:hypothetical protein
MEELTGVGPDEGFFNSWLIETFIILLGHAFFFSFVTISPLSQLLRCLEPHHH